MLILMLLIRYGITKTFVCNVSVIIYCAKIKPLVYTYAKHVAVHAYIDTFTMRTQCEYTFNVQDGKTPLQLALEQRNTEIVKYFIDGAEIDASLLDEVSNNMCVMY